VGTLSGDQSIASGGANTTVQFVDFYDPQNWYDATTYRFQPTIAGYDMITYETWWNNAANVNQFNIQLTDESGNQIVINQNPTNTTTGVTMTIARIHYMNGTTNYVTFSAFNGSSGSVSLLRGGTSYGGGGTFFTAFLIPAGGATGPTGVTGSTGSTGALGTSSAARLNIQGVTGTALTSLTTPPISTSTYSTYYNITNGGFNTLTLPSGMTAGDSGAFWVLRNNTTSYITFNPTYNSGTGPTTITIPPTTGTTLAWDGASIVLF
jgi:hypothetical protein